MGQTVSRHCATFLPANPGVRIGFGKNGIMLLCNNPDLLSLLGGELALGQTESSYSATLPRANPDLLSPLGGELASGQTVSSYSATLPPANPDLLSLLGETQGSQLDSSLSDPFMHAMATNQAHLAWILQSGGYLEEWPASSAKLPIQRHIRTPLHIPFQPH